MTAEAEAALNELYRAIRDKRISDSIAGKSTPPSIAANGKSDVGLVICQQTVGSMAVWVFDYLMTLPEEVDLVWRSQWSLVKIVYVLARAANPIHFAFTLVHNQAPYITAKECDIAFGIALWTGFLEALLCEVIMYLQVYIFAKRSSWVGTYLKAQYVVANGTNTILLAFLSKGTRHTTTQFPGLRCTPENIDMDLVGAPYAVSIAPWTVLVLITLWLTFYKYRYTKSRLVTALLRDGLIYMYGTVLFCIACTIIVYEAPVRTFPVSGSLPNMVWINIDLSRPDYSQMDPWSSKGSAGQYYLVSPHPSSPSQ
ncbi:hypothetical protein CC1G_10989 [Coprinopsis cinerea okayama7|uniref:DUF6533 domain-containing protein n=1 Tax=Coprinopsis cinerea (strain Okayama-7 / 130 / ATCC MYA-4618 / FGSC 9003) TaxID=240176 RepID=A8P713_COPC7|nr:hypothetical protein CC1G_10989 [Coprinopsis cinerea okayama7\|eukprot:XP_001839267.2 hypothetical protein CC1G_10989 [Coprinopsis cinerea okayama7\